MSTLAADGLAALTSGLSNASCFTSAGGSPAAAGPALLPGGSALTSAGWCSSAIGVGIEPGVQGSAVLSAATATGPGTSVIASAAGLDLELASCCCTGDATSSMHSSALSVAAGCEDCSSVKGSLTEGDAALQRCGWPPEMFSAAAVLGGSNRRAASSSSGNAAAAPPCGAAAGWTLPMAGKAASVHASVPGPSSAAGRFAVALVAIASRRRWARSAIPAAGHQFESRTSAACQMLRTKIRMAPVANLRSCCLPRVHNWH